MTEHFTKINGKLITDNLFVSTVADDGTDQEIQEAQVDNNRILTFGKIKWKYSDNQTVFHEDTLHNSDYSLLSTVNNNEDNYILKVNRNSSPIDLSEYTAYDLKQYGVDEIAYMTRDELNTSSERILICSRTTGLWVLTLNEDKEPSVEHVNSSPPCCYVGFDTFADNNYYILVSNNECFHTYYSLITPGDERTTITYTSEYLLQDSSSASRNITCVLTYTSDRSSTTVVYSCNGIRVNNPTRLMDPSNNTSNASGYKLITYSCTDQTNNNIQLKVMNVQASGNNHNEDTYRYTLNTNGNYYTVRPTKRTQAELTADNRYGMIWYSQTINTETSGNANTWYHADYTSGTTRIPNDGSGSSKLYVCPSISSFAAGSNTLDPTSNLYYFGTDDYNDYIGFWELCDRPTSSKGIVGLDLGVSPKVWTQFQQCVSTLYNTRESSSVLDDVWVLCSTEHGILTFAGQENSQYKYVRVSPTINSTEFNAFSSVVIGSGTRTICEYAYDALEKGIRGMYKLTINWGGTTITSAWFWYTNWANNGTNYYTACNWFTISGTAITGDSIPYIAKVFDNETLIFALGTNGDLFGSTDGLNFYRIYTHTTNTYKSVNAFISGTEVNIIGNEGGITKLIRLPGVGGFTSLPAVETIGSPLNSYVIIDGEKVLNVNTTYYAAVGSSGSVVSADGYNYVSTMKPIGLPINPPAPYSIEVNGTIKSPTITDLYTKLAVIQEAIHA